MSRSDLEEILDLTDTFAEIGRRPIPKVPALRGRTVATAFFENSTRTRMSFETAARRLSADTVAFSAGSSSLSKGESLRDTVEVVASYGADLLV
ncbi:MAG: aspartate carbamoyltransferase, partial [Actinomycetota bacterium]|nr:aspartate carbamoyltransferase [Actinomycetota bacterium]MEC8873684.1 aspartate carbamoyltransferase [Actinomycetota bacterium]